MRKVKHTLLTDDELGGFQLRAAELKGATALEKWKLTQNVFTRIKKNEKVKGSGIKEQRMEALLKNKDYANCKSEFEDAKRRLKLAKEQAVKDPVVIELHEAAEDLAMAIGEEQKILQDIFKRSAIACKKDPMQLQFSVFEENDGENQAKVGDFFQYEITLDAKTRRVRGKCNEGPGSFEKTIIDAMEESKKKPVKKKKT